MKLSYFSVLFVCLNYCFLSAQNPQKELVGLPYTTLDSLIYSEYKSGNYKKAIPYAAAGLDKARAEFGKVDSVCAHYLIWGGFFYGRLGKYPQAEPLVLEARDILAKTLGTEHDDYTICLGNLARLYYEMGNFNQTELLLLETKSIFAKTVGVNDHSYGIALSNLATLYNELGDYKKAEPLFLKAKHIFAQTTGKEHRDYAASLNGLAILYENLERYDLAKKILKESQEITKKISGTSHPNYAIKLSNLAHVYELTGDYNQAMQLLTEAEQIQVERFGEKHPQYAFYLNGMARIYRKTDQLDKALYYCQASIVANSEQLDSNSLDFAKLDHFDYFSNKQLNNSVSNLLKIFEAQYQINSDAKTLDLQFQTAQMAMRFNERVRNEFSDESNKLRMLRTNNQFVEQGIKTAVLSNKEAYKREAFRFAELNKSVLLADAMKGDRARQLGDLPDSLVRKELYLQQQATQLKKQRTEVQSKAELEEVNQQLSNINLKIDTFLKSLRNQYPKYHQLKYANITTEVEDIQEALDEESILLEYFLTDSVCYLFSVSNKAVQLFPIRVNQKDLKHRIKILYEALSNYGLIFREEEENYETYSKQAYWFYENLLSVALSDKAIKNLIIITDGELGHLPFETFLVEPAPAQKSSYSSLHYMLQDYNISYSYSATLWKENRSNPPPTNNGKILAYAATYSSVDPSLSKLRLPYDYRIRKMLLPLPNTESEIRHLEHFFQGDFLLANAANEKSFKQQSENYGVIHLAMHGVLNSHSPMLSSLAFTEDRDSLENNFLQAWEISPLSLNADMVVLSACETGYGKFEQGEGIVSLARSFMYAGVPSLVVSLWQVNDASTASIMQFFYQNLATGMRKDVALAKAKLDYIQSAKDIAAHPAFWSPFILIGNEKPITISRKSSATLWLIGGGIILLIGAGVLLLYRRKGKEIG